MDDPNTNFCGLIERHPWRAVQVTCVRQACELITACRSVGQTLNLRGAGHGSGDRNVGEGTLLINALPSAVERLSESRYRVSSATTWLELERTLNEQSRAAPVLTNWPAVTVGGTLAAGGFGSASIVSGAQTDWVRAMRVVLPDGSDIRVTDDDPRFALMCCAQGVHGFVAEAEIETRVCPDWLHWSEWRFKDAETWCAAIDALIERLPEDAEHLLAQARWGAFGISAATTRRFSVPLAGSLLHLSQQSHSAWRESLTTRSFATGVVNLWSDYVLPVSTLGQFLLDLVLDLAKEGVEGEAYPRLRILFLDRDRAPAPTALFAPHRVATSRLLAGVGVYFVLRRELGRQIAVARDVLARCLSRSGACGGRPYISGWHEIDRALMTDFYPDAMVESSKLRNRQDPDCLFNPGTMPPI